MCNIYIYIYIKNSDKCTLNTQILRKETNQASQLARPTINVMVTIERSVEEATQLAESLASPSYLVANIVDMAATGALAEMTQETSREPCTPSR